MHHIYLFCCLINFSYQGRITKQLRRLGGSYDWTRTAFTMDEVCHYHNKSERIPDLR